MLMWTLRNRFRDTQVAPTYAKIHWKSTKTVRTSLDVNLPGLSYQNWVII